MQDKMEDYGYKVDKVDATDVPAEDIDKTFKSSSIGESRGPPSSIRALCSSSPPQT